MSFTVVTVLQGHWQGFTKTLVGTFQKAVTFELPVYASYDAQIIEAV